MASTYTVDETLKAIAEGVTQVMNAKGCTICLVDESGKALDLKAWHGVGDRYRRALEKNRDIDTMEGKVLKGEVVTVDDLRETPQKVRFTEDLVAEGILSMLLLPLRVKGKEIGVLKVYGVEPRKFSKKDIQTAFTLVSQGGVAIDKARLYRRVKTMIGISQCVSSTHKLSSILKTIVESIVTAMEYKASMIRLLDEEGKVLQIRSSYGLSEAYLKKGPLVVEESPIDQEILEGKTVITPDVTKVEGVQYAEDIRLEGITSILSLPLIVKGRAIGILRVYSSAPHEFEKEEIDFLMGLASQCAIAIENARLYGHLKSEYEEFLKDVWSWYDWGKRPPKV